MFTIEVEDTSIQPSDNTMLVFIDETGNQSLKDDSFPIFGLGACAVLAKDYEAEVELPWRKVRQALLGDEQAALHACELKVENLSQDQIEAVSIFFKTSPIYRIGITGKRTTSIEKEGLGLYQIIASVMAEKIAGITRTHLNTEEVLMIFEDGPDINTSARKYFREEDLLKRGITVPIQMLKAKKGVSSGLEIADFIAHTAGATSNTFLKNGRTARRKDAAVIFGSKPELSYYLDINSVHQG